ncbi:hypothetical protein [Streptomyces sp. CB01883]|uniref:hypothetical protein n=2 Tax=unclassified Streptomyces TaxID=2593676 RepID=UPI000B2DBFAC|nr:hypothetical protein [Streptomyces sp. CB01883]
MMSGEPSNSDQAGRFHLLLSSHGEPVQHGWWGSESVARGKLARWVGEYGSMPGGRITLTDEMTGTVVQVWPQEQSSEDQDP